MKKNKILKVLTFLVLCTFCYSCSSKIVAKPVDPPLTKPQVKEIELRKRDLVVKITESILEKAKGKNINIAVVEFSELRGDGYVESAKGKLVSERLITSLVNSKNVTVVERGQLEKVLTELKLNMKGIIDSSSAKQVGKILGIDAIITGTIIELNNLSEINARMIDAQSGKIMSAVNVQEKIDLPANSNNDNEQVSVSESVNRSTKFSKRPPIPTRPKLKDRGKRNNRDRIPPSREKDYAQRKDKRRFNKHKGNRGLDRFAMLLKKNNFRELARLAEEELHYNPDNQRAKFYLGISLVELGIIKNKNNLIRRGKEFIHSVLENKNIPPHLRKKAAVVIVTSLLKLGKKREAKRFLGKLLRRSPELRKRPKIQELMNALNE